MPKSVCGTRQWSGWPATGATLSSGAGRCSSARSSSTSKRPRSSASDGRRPARRRRRSAAACRSCGGRPRAPAGCLERRGPVAPCRGRAQVPEHGHRRERAGDRRQQLAERRVGPRRSPPMRRSARPPTGDDVRRRPPTLDGEDPDDRADHRQRRTACRGRAPPCRPCRTVSIAQSLTDLRTRSITSWPTRTTGDAAPRDQARRRSSPTRQPGERSTATRSAHPARAYRNRRVDGP